MDTCTLHTLLRARERVVGCCARRIVNIWSDVRCECVPGQLGVSVVRDNSQQHQQQQWSADAESVKETKCQEEGVRRLWRHHHDGIRSSWVLYWL